MDEQASRDDVSHDADAGPVARDASTDDPTSSGGVRADWMEALREVAPYLDLGWRIVGAAAVPPIAGWGVDVFFETLPWGVLVGAGLGLVSAVVQLRQVGIELEAQSEQRSSSQRSIKQQRSPEQNRTPPSEHRTSASDPSRHDSEL